MNNINTVDLKNTETATKIVYFAFLSVFLHFAVTSATIIGIGLFVLFNSQIRKKIFAKKSHTLLIAFCGFTVLVALFYKNYIGIICSLALYLIMLVSYWVKSIITKNMLEDSLTLCCAVIIPLSLAVVVEKIIHIDNAKYRCSLWFFNANYMTAIFAAVALFCVYKIIEKHKQTLYFTSLFSCVLAMYLSGSMFAFVELFVGICMLFILRKKYIIFAGFFFLAFLGLVVLYFNPEIFPRVLLASGQADKRIEIWEWALTLIKEHPFFGQGFLTLYHNAQQNPAVKAEHFVHAHNFVLEPLISFGIIGTILIVALLCIYFKKVIKCKEGLKNNKITALILSLCSAIIIHATTDMTLMWIQTGLLYALILASVGICERELIEEKNGEMHYGK